MWSSGFHIIDTDAQSIESAETWHLTEAEAGRKANKRQNKGRSWVMIMQLSADPTHEYGNCGGDNENGVCVWDACIYSYRAYILLCVLTEVQIEFDLKCACVATVCKHFDVKACVSICMCCSPAGPKSQSNSLPGEQVAYSSKGSIPPCPRDSCLVSGGVAKLLKSLVQPWQLSAGDIFLCVCVCVCTLVFIFS